LPWIADLGIAEEDSLGLPSLKGTADPDGPESREAAADVVVIRFPHIANFDDFDLLARHPSVALRYVDSRQALGDPDLIILPGTKTSRSDFQFLRDAGLADAVEEHTRRGRAVLGICGGFQMLGARIEDPTGVEGAPGAVEGLGLLGVTTTFASDKTTVQVEGVLQADQGLFAHTAATAFSGYEIHMGRTRGGAAPLTLVREADGSLRPEGAVSVDGWVVGTSVHGLLQNVNVVDALVANLANRRGVAVDPLAHHRDPYDRLADVLRESLDVSRLYLIAGLARPSA